MHGLQAGKRRARESPGRWHARATSGGGVMRHDERLLHRTSPGLADVVFVQVPHVARLGVAGVNDHAPAEHELLAFG